MAITTELAEHLNNHKALTKDGLQSLVNTIKSELERREVTELDEAIFLAIQMTFDVAFKEGITEAIKTLNKNGIS